MIRVRLAVILAVALVGVWLWGGLPAPAQVGGSIEGDLIGFDGKPLIGVTVLIDRQDIKQHFETKTDNKGHWFHAGLPLSNSYTITFKQGDQIIYSYQRVPIRLGEATRVDINLKAEREKQQAGTPQETEEQRKRRETAEKQRTNFQELKKRFDQGVVFLNSNQYDQAVTEFETCVQLDPTQHVVFAYLADSYGGVKRYDDASKAYQKAIEVLSAEQASPDKNQKLAAYYNNLGSVLGRAGKAQEAQGAFAKAVELDPAGAGRYYFNMGAIMVNTGKTDEAVDAFRKAIAADPNYAEAYYQLGVALTGKATLDKEGKIIPAAGTVESLQKYLQLQPEGRYAQAAKDLLSTLGGQIQTEVSTKKKKR